MTFSLDEILTERQKVAWRLLRDGSHTEILYGGAAGGGKSFLGCLYLLVWAYKYPGTRYVMGRSVLKTLKETTLKTFFDVCTMFGLKAGEHYTYNVSTGAITLDNGSEILTKDLKWEPSDPNFDELGSLEITGAFIDECNQTVSKAREILASRIRYRLTEYGLMGKLLMSCNPARNWVYHEFYDPSRKGTLLDYRAFVQAKVSDNPHIPAEYIVKLDRLTGADKERLRDGNWDYDLDPFQLITPEAIGALWSNIHVPEGDGYITADVARYGSDRSVIMLWAGYVVKEVHSFQGNATTETAAFIRSLCETKGVPLSHVTVDDDGVGGGVVDLLPGCVPFLNGSSPVSMPGEKERYKNLKTQCAYKLAGIMNGNGVHVRDTTYREHIAQELPWIKRAKVDDDTMLFIMPKIDVKQGLGRSPDYADNFIMRMRFELEPTPTMADALRLRAAGMPRKDVDFTFTERDVQ